jgi:ABC-type antimicrobial peptide transport system permease subunit
MIKHYLKVSFRNLWKYKYQTLVSVAGLAIGFACFAMATLWIRYEMTYDSFHRNADRMYCVVEPGFFDPNSVSRQCASPMSGHLKATFPEIAHATPLAALQNQDVETDEIHHTIDVLKIDSSFFGMFDVKLIAGSMDFLIPESRNIAITAEKARQLYGVESPLGKRIKWRSDEHTVCAVVTGLPKRSNYPFDILLALTKYGWQRSSGEHALVELVEGVDVEAFKKKLHEHVIKYGDNHEITRIGLVPLTSVRYTGPNVFRDIEFRYIIIFSVVGSLLILCTLFNYLALFVSRFRLRQQELALRVICGASNRSLFVLLSIEFIVSLLIALLFGLFLIEAVVRPFMILSEIRLELSAIYFESLIYIVGITVIALLTFIVVLAVFRRRTLNLSIRRSNKKLFRKTSIVFQLVISILLTFCTMIILKQMYHLHNTDLGFALKNRGSVAMLGELDITALRNRIQQMPEITETVTGYYPLLSRYNVRQSSKVLDWDGRPADAELVNIERIAVSEQFLSYYEIKVAEGELLNDHDAEQDVMINESAAKIFGWNTAAGKSFKVQSSDKTYVVKGVIKNIYNQSPTDTPRPILYHIETTDYPSILFKYAGEWKLCKTKIDEFVRAEYPNARYHISNIEEEYDGHLKSENALLTILTVVSLTCVLICIFGFVSMVSLTCEERRREIAIRKINGATIKDILDIFFKEHITLLAVGALIAFPVGYSIMKRWLEQYVVRTEMSAWVYVSILLSLTLAIALCVGKKVYNTSRENPIEAIKH